MPIIKVFTQDKSTTGSLHSQQDTEVLINNVYLINLVPCKLDLTSTPFLDSTIITYELDLPTAGKKNGFNLLEEKDFTIPFIIDAIPNSTSSHQLPTQDNKNVWIIATDGEYPIT